MDSTRGRTIEPVRAAATSPPPTARPVLQRLVVLASGAVLTGVTAVLACRAAGADAATPVTQVLAFLPWLLVPTLAALLLTALVRWRAGMLWALVAMALTGGFTIPYATEARAGSRSGPVVAELAVLTSNVEFGQGTPGLVRTIRAEKPDIVFVQECEVLCREQLSRDIPRSDYPYRNIVEEGGARGSTILSVHPLTDTEGIDSTLAMPGAEARMGGRSVRLQLAHPLPPIPGGVASWRTELGRVAAYAARHRDGPSIIAGDFNATRDHAAFRDVLTAGGLHDSAVAAGAGRTPSWPAAVPGPLGVQIDHVLVSDDFTVRAARFIDIPDTDHRALLVRLGLHAGERSRPAHRGGTQDHG